MIREWTLTRTKAHGVALGGVLKMDVHGSVATLERLGVEIAPGRYRLRLTESARAARGDLWAPEGVTVDGDVTHILPLIEGVPGRVGLRIHALNEASSSDGCIGVGFTHTDTTIGQSRPAVEQVVNALHSPTDEFWVTILPLPEG